MRSLAVLISYKKKLILKQLIPYIYICLFLLTATRASIPINDLFGSKICNCDCFFYLFFSLLRYFTNEFFSIISI